MCPSTSILLDPDYIISCYLQKWVYRDSSSSSSSSDYYSQY